MLMRRLLVLLAVVTLALLAGCVSPLPVEQQQKLDGLVVYGWVNIAPSEDVTARGLAFPGVKEACLRLKDDWCRSPGDYNFVSLLLMNTYWGGSRGVGTFVHKSEPVSRNDIVVVRMRAGATAEFVRIASRGEREDCRWVGGGISRAMTAAGVICESYDWREVAPLFYE
jgi:hypothetical protein